MSKSPRRLEISGDELADAMTHMPDDPFTAYLDLETGRIVEVARAGGEYASDIESGEEELVEQDPDRFVEVPSVRAREEYDRMVLFAERIEEADIRDQLMLALDGAGAFGRFRQVVGRYPDISSAWQSFRRRELAEIARRWLREYGVEPELTFARLDPPVQPQAGSEKRGAEVGLRELLLLGAPEGKTELIRGRVLRMIRAPSPSEARRIFKTVAREIYESSGIAWRKRFVEGQNSVDVGTYHLSVEGPVVPLEVEVDSALWRKFGG